MLDFAEVRTPSRRTLASMAEQKKASAVVSAVSEKFRSFTCLSCQMTFETYAELGQHKSQVHQKRLLSCATQKAREIKVEETVNTSVSGLPAEEAGGFGQGFMELVSNAIDSVPETTFNNMHGTIRDINSPEGLYYQVKNGNLGAVEKVKLNISENWTRKNVWESGWEPTNNRLSWRKYDMDLKSQQCLLKMSTLSWPQQKIFKEAYDKLKVSNTANNVATNSSPTKELIKRKPTLVQGLNLKPLGNHTKRCEFRQNLIKGRK